MPQVHLFQTRDNSLKIVYQKLYSIDDELLLVLNAHLLTEAFLYRFIQSKLKTPKHLDDARLTYHQIYSFARALRQSNRSEQWFWSIIKELNSIRNIIVHQIEPVNIKERIDTLFQLAKDKIDIHAPGADPKEREEKRQQYFFIILCGVTYNLTNDSFIL